MALSDKTNLLVHGLHKTAIPTDRRRDQKIHPRRTATYRNKHRNTRSLVSPSVQKIHRKTQSKDDPVRSVTLETQQGQVMVCMSIQATHGVAGKSGLDQTNTQSIRRVFRCQTVSYGLSIGAQVDQKDSTAIEARLCGSRSI